MSSNVWCFESSVEQDYCWFLGEYIRETDATKNPDDMKTIRGFWDNRDDWETIVKRAACERNTWYVWWMEGVRAYARHEGAIE